ncbi:MAG: EamA family transporter [Thioalkalivibrionaceae bacterium]
MLDTGSIRSLLLNATLLAAMLATAHGLLKWATSRADLSYQDMLLTMWPGIGAALALYGGIFFYYLFVLRHHEISALYGAYTGLSVVFVLALGHWLFDEALTPIQIAGVILVAAGVLLIGSPMLFERSGT